LPPIRQKKSAKARSQIEAYIRHLILERLEDTLESIEGVIKQLRKLPWQDPEERVEAHVVKATLRVCRSKYTSISLVSDVLSGLQVYQDRVVIRVVDSLLEGVYRGLEVRVRRDFQRMIGYARLIGDLYTYEVVSAPLIFQLLHTLLEHGHEVG
ncbi:unnamed protein product, partial [Discosporangium mesarthrocarpum]